MNPYVVIRWRDQYQVWFSRCKGQLLETHGMPTEAQKGGLCLTQQRKSACYLKKHPLAGVMISSAGMVDPDMGEILLCRLTNSQLCRHPIQKGNQRDLSDPLQIENDVNCVIPRSPQAMQKIEQCCHLDDWDRDRRLPLARWSGLSWL